METQHLSMVSALVFVVVSDNHLYGASENSSESSSCSSWAFIFSQLYVSAWFLLWYSDAVAWSFFRIMPTWGVRGISYAVRILNGGWGVSNDLSNEIEFLLVVQDWVGRIVPSTTQAG
jgi:hypothetical protein